MATVYGLRELYGGAITVELPTELIDSRYVYSARGLSGSESPHHRHGAVMHLLITTPCCWNALQFAPYSNRSFLILHWPPHKQYSIYRIDEYNNLLTNVLLTQRNPANPRPPRGLPLPRDPDFHHHRDQQLRRGPRPSHDRDDHHHDRKRYNHNLNHDDRILRC